MGSENMGARQKDLTQGCRGDVLARESFNLSLWWIIRVCGGLLDQLLDCGLVEQLFGQLVG